MGYSPDHKRIKARYNPKPNAAERRHIERVKERPCFGCGVFGAVAHHTLLDFPEKRWRRDHMCLLPLCDPCHRTLHTVFGNEADWIASVERTEDEAVAEILWLRGLSMEAERKAA